METVEKNKTRGILEEVLLLPALSFVHFSGQTE